MKKFIVATKNKGKIDEIKQILSDMPFDVMSMEELNIFSDIDEKGSTYEENALIKAREIYGLTGEIVMADDSGLEVDHLGGSPGIYTSRFGGEWASYEFKIQKLLALLDGVPLEKRTARFVCAIAVVLTKDISFTVRATCEGYIGFEPQGNNGFGYDPIFFVKEYNMTTAQMNPLDKHKISHRGKALKLMVERLEDYFAN